MKELVDDYEEKSKKDYSNKPYIFESSVSEQALYNPKYGDDRVCKCGHRYYRHFDTYDDMYACGCKYCGCWDFEEDIKSARKTKLQKIKDLLKS